MVADRETRRLSFGSVATDYDRYRPPPPPQALDWLIPPGAQAILDLAAGTGVVTRELIGRATRVIAVEPDERMRAVLAAGCPEAEVLAGRGEDIPLPAASVDAVVISAAWHWLDPALAVPEITRVLNDLGWFTFVFPWVPFSVWCLAIAVPIMQDRSAVPVYPRWVAYLNIWTAIFFVPAGIIVFTKTGPLAWNGIFALYLPLFIFFGWVVAMSVTTFQAVANQNPAEDVATPTRLGAASGGTRSHWSC